MTTVAHRCRAPNSIANKNSSSIANKNSSSSIANKNSSSIANKSNNSSNNSQDKDTTAGHCNLSRHIATATALNSKIPTTATATTTMSSGNCDTAASSRVPATRGAHNSNIDKNNNSNIDNNNSNSNSNIAKNNSNNNSDKNNSDKNSGHHFCREKMLVPSCALLALIVVLIGPIGGAHGVQRVTFEKMTNRDYSGQTYYSIQNVSLFECLGWCKEELSCTSAAFSFVVNPFAALQETTCMLQNETLARKVVNQYSSQSALAMLPQPQKATNLYFFNKINVRSELTCNRLWAAERFPNKRLRAHSNQMFANVPNKEICLGYCMSHTDFVCRSFEYNYMTQQCSLSEHDRRSPQILQQVQLAQQQLLATASSNGNSMQQQQQAIQDLQDAPGVDYYENACLLSEDICPDARIYDYAKIGLPHQRVAHFVELNYYPDKEMLVKSQAGCVRACTIEHEFICRSIVYRSSNKQGQPNCALYHLDQKTFPDGAETFASQVMQPLLDSGETSAVYLEAMCANDTLIAPPMTPQPSSPPPNLIIPLGPSSTLYPPPSSSASSLSSSSASSASSSSSSSSSLSTSQQQQQQQQANNGNNNMIESTRPGFSLLPSPTPPSNILIHPVGGNGNIGINAGNGGGGSGITPNGRPNIQTITVSGLSGASGSNGIMSTASSTISPMITGQPVRDNDDNIMGGGGGGGGGGNSNPLVGSRPNNGMISNGQFISSSSSSNNGLGGNVLTNPNMDQNCDAHGFCYDVSLKCTDTKIVVNVKTEKPFHGRIYALGRSETCNAHIKNQQQFSLEMFLTGQDCNTQSGSGIYTNTIVLQHHNVVLTKADKVYHVRCTYETASRNVTFGMMPVRDMFDSENLTRDPDTIHITAAPDAPLPKITILTSDGREASTVRIGDRLTFRIEIPENTPYGIFARSCVAMAKDARSTFEIIDDNGCPVDHTIFPNFIQINNALESNYEAFRFTESYGVIFQCNVKYCIGKCDSVICNIGGREQVEAWGRKRRSVSANDTGDGEMVDDMTLSREIVVLDMKEGQSTDPTSLKSLRLPESKARYNGLQTHCVTGTTMIALIIAVSLLIILYVCTIAYFTTRTHTRISPIKASSNYH